MATKLYDVGSHSYLYSEDNYKEELCLCAESIGMRREWIKFNELFGFWFFDLWGMPLHDAKKVFPVSAEETIIDFMLAMDE